MCEYVDHLHEHFTSPVVIQDAHYMPPKARNWLGSQSALLWKKKQNFALFTAAGIDRSALWFQDPGYSCEMLEESVNRHEYPEGDIWKQEIKK